MLDVIEAKRDEDEDDFRHIYLGEPREDDDAVVIKRSWIKAALDACCKLGLDRGPARRIGFDVADSGVDKNALVLMEGIGACRVEEWKGGEDELLKSAGSVHKAARENGAEIDYDSIGVGAFAGAHFQSLNAEFGVTLAYRRFNAGGAVLNPKAKVDPKDPKSAANGDYYANLKAQAWWELATRFRNTFNAVFKGTEYTRDKILVVGPHYITDTGLSTGSTGFSGQTRAGFEAYVTAAREVAADFGLMYFDSYAYMQANGGGTLISGDSIHPNDTGHGVIADGIMTTTAFLNQGPAPSITSWSASGTDLVLSWAPVPGATSYEVRLVEASAITVSSVIAATGTRHTFPAPGAGTYTAMVRAGSGPWTVATGLVTL